MLGRSDVTLEENVRAPWEIARILGAADDEPFPRPAARRVEKQPVQHLLPIGGPRAEIGERRARTAWRRRRTIALGIDAAVERGDPARAEALAQRGQGRAAGIAQHQRERRKPVRPDIFDRLAGGEARQRHGAVEIVEDR